jgi:RHS repeat-associated protein
MVVQPDGTVVEHVYDADGNRVETTVTPSAGTPVTTEYLVDTVGGLSHVVAESDGVALTALYVRAGDELLAVVRPSGQIWETRWVHHDAIGSVRALTDEAGLVTDETSCTAFGERIVDSGSDSLAYGFAGEPFDEATGLAYHRARWMDPEVGRFVGPDRFTGTAETPSTLHRHLYGNNNPLAFTDASGLFSEAETLGVAGIIGILSSMARCTPGGALRPGNGTVLVKSLHAKFGPWEKSGSGEAWIPIYFTLQLMPGSYRADTRISQFMLGKSGGKESQQFKDWHRDSPIGEPYWWDGVAWHAGFGAWSTSGGSEVSEWRDEAGQHGNEGYPVLWSDMDGNGFFLFCTDVGDTRKVRASVYWGFRIDIPSADATHLKTAGPTVVIC